MHSKKLYYQPIADLTKEWLSKSKRSIKNTRYLDIGCGAGLGPKQFGEFFNLEAWGISKEPFAHKIDHPMRGDVYKLIDDFDEGFFTVISTVNFMEYVYYDLPKPAQMHFLSKVRRVLSNDGILLVSEPTTYKNGIKRMIEDAGFRIVKEKTKETIFSILAVKR